MKVMRAHVQTMTNLSNNMTMLIPFSLILINKQSTIQRYVTNFPGPVKLITNISYIV